MCDKDFYMQLPAIGKRFVVVHCQNIVSDYPSEAQWIGRTVQVTGYEPLGTHGLNTMPMIMCKVLPNGPRWNFFAAMLKPAYSHTPRQVDPHICPKCGSNNVDQVDTFESERGKGWFDVECYECKAQWATDWVCTNLDLHNDRKANTVQPGHIGYASINGKQVICCTTGKQRYNDQIGQMEIEVITPDNDVLYVCLDDLWDDQTVSVDTLDISNFGGDTYTTIDYWDCDCDSGYEYIKPKSQDYCQECDRCREENPDSRVNEVLKYVYQR